MQKALIYIDANISGELNLRALAAMLEVTLGYLSTIFHRETDQTLTEYVTQQRMKVAFQLLQTTHLQMQTIAQICGMQDANYFTEVFKRCYHITPPAGAPGASISRQSGGNTARGVMSINRAGFTPYLSIKTYFIRAKYDMM